jgi:cytochrome c oxidase assembly protein Cox11
MRIGAYANVFPKSKNPANRMIAGFSSILVIPLGTTEYLWPLDCQAFAEPSRIGHRIGIPIK